MAVILAFLFRMFLLEAFVIPTGSMAPTLHGRHMDVECSQCEYQYQTGASSENPDAPRFELVVKTTCPICRYSMWLDKEQKPNQQSFMGDRILVSKFSYSISQPKRWQVIVFKYPGNAKQNYIKRLVGLPGERIKIKGGDIHVVPAKESNREAFRIVRKPPGKLLAMLQLVHDTNYVAKDLKNVGWPGGLRRWRAWAPGGASTDGIWTKTTKNRPYYHTGGETDQVCFLRYRHFIPSQVDWNTIVTAKETDRKPKDLKDEFKARFNPAADPDDQKHAAGTLITDFYAYNNGNVFENTRRPGLHWVGDLAAEYEVEVEGDKGHLLLDCVEGGAHFQCSIDVANGEATLSRRQPTGETGLFTDQQGKTRKNPVGETKIKKPGSYRLRFSNVDNEVLLWVNNRLVQFDGPTTYESEAIVAPRWRQDDPGDLAPVGIGTRSLAMQVKRMRVFRDVYYVALDTKQKNMSQTDYLMGFDEGRFSNYKEWDQTNFFTHRFEQLIPEKGSMGKEDFLPMGDNSPESSDGRMWPALDDKQKHTVHRDLLIGQAMFVYWPHSWRQKTGSSGQSLPVIPNFRQMRLIK